MQEKEFKTGSLTLKAELFAHDPLSKNSVHTSETLSMRQSDTWCCYFSCLPPFCDLSSAESVKVPEKKAFPPNIKSGIKLKPPASSFTFKKILASQKRSKNGLLDYRLDVIVARIIGRAKLYRGRG